MKYEILARYMKCGEVIGFKIREIQTGKILKVKYNEFMKLAKQGEVKEVKVNTIENKDYLVGKKISDITVSGIKGIFDIYGRVTDEDGRVIGYEVIDVDTYEKSKISIETAWELAFNESLNGVRAVFKDNKKSLIVENVVNIV